MSLDELQTAVASENLLSEPADPARRVEQLGQAALAARAILLEARERRLRLLLLGRDVARAFGVVGVRPAMLESFLVGGVRAILFPHPSGRSRWWNEPGRRDLARAVLVGALAIVRPLPRGRPPRAPAPCRSCGAAGRHHALGLCRGCYEAARARRRTLRVQAKRRSLSP